jgi:ATP-binding cassette subfamily B protein
MVAQTLLTLALPWPLQFMIDHVLEAKAELGNTAAQYSLFEFIVSLASFRTPKLHFLYLGIGALFIIYSSNSILVYLQNTQLARLGQQVVLRIRQNLFSQIMNLPQSFFEKAQTGDLTSRISKDTVDTQDILESLLTIFVSSLPTVVGILVLSFILDWIYALTFVLAIPLVFWANVVFARLTKKAVRKQRNVEGDMASSVQEALYLNKAVKTLCLEEDLVENFAKSSAESADFGVQAGRFQGMLTASLDLLIGCTSLLVLFVGILRIVHGGLTVGQLLVFISYLNSLFKPIREISKFTARFAKSTAALERIDEIARLVPEEIGAADSPDARTAPRFKGKIEMKGVTFGYDPDQPVLKDFSFTFGAGRKIAVVGDSGSGKSTVLQLLMRLHDPQHGQVKIDGVDIRSYTLNSLRNQMAIVLQDSYIFNMSIEENIALAKPGARKAEVINAAVIAGAHEFIGELPDGYDTWLGEGGAGLSGGQKRRLALARAFLRDAPIVLLDEPTVGLDAASEEKVSEAMTRLTRGRTTLLVTHQLSTVTDADLILVLSGGSVVDSGTHGGLLAREGIYKDFWEKQSGSTEVGESNGHSDSSQGS